ncbi:MAG: response regulator [Desulfobacterales bacterium]|jgi:DNA-binding NtrC family response regulator
MEKRILLVDDDKIILQLYGDFLDHQDCRYDAADSVAAAINLLERHSYGIVLTDKNMPDSAGGNMGGMEVLRYVREKFPSSEVIMITGYADVHSAVEAMKLGAFDYLVKPVALAELKEKLDRIWEYRKFLSASDTFQTYRTLLRQVLHHLINEKQLEGDQLEEILKTLGARIDHLFGLQREYEAIIDKQTENLGTIETQLEALIATLPEDSPYHEWLAKILNQSRKGI